MKKEEFIPVDLVKKLYGEGKSETGIITQLRSQGFTPSQIDKALKAVPKPAAYKGRLPREVLPPQPKAAEPETRLSPIGKAPVGAPPERIVVPEHLKLMDVGHAPRPAPARKTEELPPPVPVQPRPVGTGKIGVEELVEQVVAEHERKVEGNIKKLLADHEENLKRIETLFSRLDSLGASVKNFEKSVDERFAATDATLTELTKTIDGLEKAFKELSHFVKK